MLEQLIEEQNNRGGVWLNQLDTGTKIEVQTNNTLYEIEILDNNNLFIKGGSYFPETKKAKINGCTWGGSALRVNWLGINMHIEICHPTKIGKIITTSSIKAIKVIASDDSWEYEI